MNLNISYKDRAYPPECLRAYNSSAFLIGHS